MESPNAENQKFSFFYNKFLALILLAISSAFVWVVLYQLTSVAIWIAVHSEDMDALDIFQVALGVPLFLGCGLFLGLGIVLSVHKLLKFTPDLTIDSQGIYEDMFITPRGFLPWSAITGVTQGGILELDPINRETNEAILKKLKSRNFGFGYTAPSGIKISFIEGSGTKSTGSVLQSLWGSLFKIHFPNNFMVINPKQLWTRGENVHDILFTMWLKYSPHASTFQIADVTHLVHTKSDSARDGTHFSM